MLRKEQEINQRLRQVEPLKDEFLANTSHELRTPIHGIHGLAETMLGGASGELAEATRTNLAMILASGRRLATLVDDILDFTRLTHRKLALRRGPVDLVRLRFPSRPKSTNPLRVNCPEHKLAAPLPFPVPTLNSKPDLSRLDRDRNLTLDSRSHR